RSRALALAFLRPALCVRRLASSLIARPRAATASPQTLLRDRAMNPRTLYDKIWDDHLVDAQPDGTCLLYVDRHLVHEVTSPQAFEGLRMAGRRVRAPQKTL